MDSSLIRNIEEVPVNVENVDLNPSIDEVEYLQLKSDFFEDQTELWNKLIIKEEEAILKEIQELTEKFNERKIEKERLIRILNDLKVEADSLQFERWHAAQRALGERGDFVEREISRV